MRAAVKGTRWGGGSATGSKALAFVWLAAFVTDLCAAAAAEPGVVCEQVAKQGGAAVCRTVPGSRVWISGQTTRADAEGIFVVGFDRDAPETERVLIQPPDGEVLEHVFEIERRRYSISRIDGLPPSQVDLYSKTQLAQIAESSARKAKGDASRAEIHAFADRFDWPLGAPTRRDGRSVRLPSKSIGRKTSGFGAQRILNGVEKRPHYGLDLAAPSGTPIAAPAGGVVALADDALYFEGAMIVIDHGQGFLSKYLHVSRIDVEVGEWVERGQVIGAVGSRGRSTGPHLCWRLKWRDRNLDPELWIRPEWQRSR